jgi:hypothetical protein
MPNAQNVDLDHKTMRHIEINKEWNDRQPFVGKPNDISTEEVGLIKETHSAECTINVNLFHMLGDNSPKIKYKDAGWVYPKGSISEAQMEEAREHLIKHGTPPIFYNSHTEKRNEQ